MVQSKAVRSEKLSLAACKRIEKEYGRLPAYPGDPAEGEFVVFDGDTLKNPNSWVVCTVNADGTEYKLNGKPIEKRYVGPMWAYYSTIRLGGVCLRQRELMFGLMLDAMNGGAQ